MERGGEGGGWIWKGVKRTTGLIAFNDLQELMKREALYKSLHQQLSAAAEAIGERVLATPGNPISIAMTLDGLDRVQLTEAGNGEGATGQSGEPRTELNHTTSVDPSVGPSTLHQFQEIATVGPEPTFLGSMLWSRYIVRERFISFSSTFFA